MEMAWGDFNADVLARVFFRINVIIAIVLKNRGPKTGQMVPRPVKRFAKAEKWDMHREAFTQKKPLHRNFDTQTRLQRHRGVLTQKPLRTEAFLHRVAFTHRSLYTEKS